MTAYKLLATIAFAALLLASCGGAPPAYAPPFQRAEMQPDVKPVSRFVSAGDPDAATYFVRDVSPTIEGGSWRWTYRRPELKFWLDSAKGQTFSVDFSVAGATFGQTGPITLSVFVNGKLLVRNRYEKPGDYRLERPVPAAWLRTDAPTIVALEPDKVYVSPSDGAKLGIILQRAGFKS